jgi:hypothetical protein
MAKQPQNEVIVVGFNYDVLETEVAEQAQSAAARIREKVKRTVEDIIEVGKDLLAVKEALPHGAFGRWLKAEFGWGERMAQNFMSVAERFGPKTEMIADLRIARSPLNGRPPGNRSRRRKPRRSSPRRGRKGRGRAGVPLRISLLPSL